MVKVIRQEAAEHDKGERLCLEWAANTTGLFQKIHKGFREFDLELAQVLHLP